MTPLRIKKWLTVFVATAAIGALGACGSNSTETGTESGTSAAAGADIPAYVSTLADTHADENDGDYDASKASTIKLADGATKVTAGSDGGKAKVSGDVVTISTAGTYLISGTLSDGQIVVNSEADGKVVLVLDGANVTSGTTSPIQVIQADETVVVLADGSTNTLADSAKSGADDEEDDAPNATLWSADDLTIAGTGTLNVKGLSNDAITSKDGLVILSGKINVDAVDDGIRGKDYLVVADGTINVDADGDGFKSDKDSFDTADDETEADLGSVAILGGKISIAAGDDGVHAEGGLTVSAGTIDISKSEEGLEGAAILISGGDVSVVSADDGLNAASDVASTLVIAISGGTTYVDAEGDGLDSNGSILISGGDTTVDGPTSGGNGALDADGGISITGGTLLAVGSDGMAQTPGDDSSQGWLTYTGALAAGQTVAVLDADGKELASHKVAKQAGSLVFSSADVKSGESYTITVNGSEAGTVTAGEGGNAGFGGGPGGGQGGGPGDGGQGGPPEDSN